MYCLSLPPWLYYSTSIWRGVLVMKLLIVQIYPVSYYFIPLGLKYNLPICNAL
jgi:hypothetical protein